MTKDSGIYSRSVLFWGEEKQEKLSASSVLVAGAGGLGCSVAENLARSGIGRLLIMDSGTVDEPDLGRQILYNKDDVGRKKTEAAAERLSSIGGNTEIIPVNAEIEDTDSFRRVMGEISCDGVADCLDNYSSRFILEEMIPGGAFMVHGGVEGDFGQVTTIMKGGTPGLADIYKGCIDSTDTVPVCPQIVISTGSFMALEVLRNIWGEPRLLNTMLVIELSDFSMFRISLA